MSKRRVVVTGLGIVSPVGNDVAGAWATILAGRSGIDVVARFDTASFPTHFGGEIRALNLEPYMSTKDARRMDAFMQYGVVAGMQAMRDSGLVVTEANSDRIGVLMGSGMGGLESIEQTYDKYLETHSPKKVSPFFIPASIINLVSGHLSIAFKITGPNLAVATACTTSTHAVGLAMRLIQYGEADAMLAGGSEMSTCVTGMSGFAQAKALSQRNDDPQGASRPWDKDRDGFVMGDGAGAMMLEEYDQAKARGAKIYAEIVGFGMSGDAFHVTAPGRAQGHGQGSGRCAVESGPSAIRQCACHLHRAWRSRGDHRDPPRLRAGRRQTGRQFHQIDDRPPAGRRRGRRSDLLRACVARSGRTSDHQFAYAGRGLRSRLRSEYRASDVDRIRPFQFLWVRWHQRFAHFPPILSR